MRPFENVATLARKGNHSIYDSVGYGIDEEHTTAQQDDNLATCCC